LTNDGTVALDTGGSLTAGKVVNDGAIDIHYGGPGTFTCGGAFTNDGSATLDDSYKTTIGGAVSGTGDFTIQRASVLEFAKAVSSGQSVTFGEDVNHLYLNSPSWFAGTIEDFTTVGDSVTAKTFAEAQTLLTYTQTDADSCS
jgi:predicted outer membrane repeat protein